MEIDSTSGDTFVMKLDRDEMILINNALNEVCHGLDSVEFSTRVGSSRDKALSVLLEVRDALGE